MDFPQGRFLQHDQLLGLFHRSPRKRPGSGFGSPVQRMPHRAVESLPNEGMIYRTAVRDHLRLWPARSASALTTNVHRVWGGLVTVVPSPSILGFGIECEEARWQS